MTKRVYQFLPFVLSGDVAEQFNVLKQRLGIKGQGQLIAELIRRCYARLDNTDMINMHVPATTRALFEHMKSIVHEPSDEQLVAKAIVFYHEYICKLQGKIGEAYSPSHSREEPQLSATPKTQIPQVGNIVYPKFSKK